MRDAGQRALAAAAAVAVLGGIALAIGALRDPGRAAFAYLAAWLSVWSTVTGVLVLILAHEIVGSTWFLVLRRPADAVCATLVALAVLFLPIVAWMHVLYPWTDPGALAPALRAEVERKTIYLNEPFFLLRAALYFAIWIGALLAVHRAEAREGDGEARERRRRRVAAIAAIPTGFAIYFAAVDWAMSLEPGWTSSAFGVVVAAGGFASGLALLIVLAALLRAAGPLRGIVAVSHFHAAGKLLLAFVCFWAYVGFFQFLIVWIADVPSEVSWYVPRAAGAWAFWAIGVAVAHFAIPFVALLSRGLKRTPAALATVAVLLLAAHAVEAFWLVMPAHAPADARPRWIDAAAYAAVLGGVTAVALWRARGRAPVVARDARFARGLRFETR